MSPVVNADSSQHRCGPMSPGGQLHSCCKTRGRGPFGEENCVARWEGAWIQGITMCREPSSPRGRTARTLRVLGSDQLVPMRGLGV